MEMVKNSPEEVNINECGILLVFAEWCGFCRQVKPEFLKLQQDQDCVNIYCIDLEEYSKENIPTEITGVPISTIPHIALLGNGKAVKYDGNRTALAMKQAALKNCNILLSGGHWETPKNRSDRKLELKKFGPHCFLLPNELKFPICDSRGKISREGLLAAYKRAREWKYDEVAAKAKHLLDSHPLRGGQSNCVLM